jgi:hypothetical protein
MAAKMVMRVFAMGEHQPVLHLSYIAMVVTFEHGLIVPSAQVVEFRRCFFVFGAAFLFQAVLVLTDPSRLSPQL